jgi:hypothetical protein
MDAASRDAGKALPAHTCFRITGRLALPGTLQVCLRDREAQALAELLPLLGCGEEAAAMAFDALADALPHPLARPALEQIAGDERVHDALLTRLRRSLPAPLEARTTLAASRRFHVRLGVGGTAAHLARIAALDSAVCTILSRLIRRGTAVAADPVIAGIFCNIRNDEARHVALSRRLALAGGGAAKLRDIGAATRGSLADILSLAAPAFDALGVDPDALDRTLRRLPDGLLAG